MRATKGMTAVMTKKYSTLTRTALFCAMLAICSWISVPFDPPFTLQTFAVFFCAGLLGGKQAFAAVLCYLALGAAGVPVFAGFRGGIAQLAGPTGGYLIGFLPAVSSVSLLPKKLPLYVRMLCGLLVCYAFGTAWYCLLYVRDAGIHGIGTALLRCVLPFIPFDLLKLFLASKATSATEKQLKTK